MKQLTISDLFKRPCRWSRISLGINNTVADKIKPIILSSNFEAMAQSKNETCEYLLISVPIWIDSDKMSNKLVLKDISKEEVTELNI